MVATKGKYLADQLFGPLPGGEDVLQRLPQRAGWRHLPLGKLGEADDNLQDVIEVVGDATSQCADGFHLLRLAQLGFEVSPRGDVTKGYNRASHDVFGTSDVGRAILDGNGAVITGAEENGSAEWHYSFVAERPVQGIFYHRPTELVDQREHGVHRQALGLVECPP